VVIAILIGIACGFLNGVLVANLGIPPILAPWGLRMHLPEFAWF